jgi:multidrug transporter EmrE-like cation transporter
MKTVVAAVLIVTAVFFLVLVLAQVLTGYDFSAAYAMLGGFGGGELALSAIIKHGENKQINQYEKEKDKHD